MFLFILRMHLWNFQSWWFRTLFSYSSRRGCRFALCRCARVAQTRVQSWLVMSIISDWFEACEIAYRYLRVHMLYSVVFSLLFQVQTVWRSFSIFEFVLSLTLGHAWISSPLKSACWFCKWSYERCKSLRTLRRLGPNLESAQTAAELVDIEGIRVVHLQAGKGLGKWFNCGDSKVWGKERCHFVFPSMLLSMRNS